jgi:hypothetical protein
MIVCQQYWHPKTTRGGSVTSLIHNFQAWRKEDLLIVSLV